MYQFLTYFSIFSALLPIVFWRGYKKTRETLIVILILATVSFASDLASIAYYYLFGGSTYWIINIYQYLEIVLVYFFFYLLLDRGKFVLLLMVLMILLSTWNHLSVGNANLIAGAISISSIVTVVLCLYYLVEIFNKETDIFIENNPLFLVVVGVFTYYSGGLFSWLVESYSVESSTFSWAFHNISNILKNIFFAIGLWKAKQASTVIEK